MPSVAASYTDIGGFAPYLSGLQSGGIRVLRGRNYRFNANTLFSGWGGVKVSGGFSYASTPLYHLTNIGDKSYLCCPEGIFLWTGDDWVKALGLIPNLPSCIEEDRYSSYPWTEGMVGDSMFLSHPSVGIIRYCFSKKSFNLVDTSVLTGPVLGICEAGCRLIALQKDTVSWSEIDAGHIFTDNPVANGFSSLSVMGYGEPYGVYSYGDGFVILTSSGIARGKPIDSIAAFSISLVTKTRKPIQATAITYYEDNTVIFLDKKGLQIIAPSNGAIGIKVEPFEPKMSSWIVSNLLQRENRLAGYNNIKLTYSRETEELFISLPPPLGKGELIGLKTRALVFNFVSGKWCSLDQPHYAIGPVNSLHHSDQSYNLGMLDQDMELVWWNGTNHIKGNPLDSFVVLGPIRPNLENRPRTVSTLKKVSIDIDNATEYFWGIEENGLAGEEDNWQDVTQLPSRFVAEVGTTNDLNHRLGLNTKTKRLSKCSDELFTQTYTCMSNGVYHTFNIYTEAEGYYTLYALSAYFNVPDVSK